MLTRDKNGNELELFSLRSRRFCSLLQTANAAYRTTFHSQATLQKRIFLDDLATACGIIIYAGLLGYLYSNIFDQIFSCETECNTRLPERATQA